MPRLSTATAASSRDPSRPIRYGARFRISILLLLSALNTVLLAGLAAASFAALLQGPDPERAALVEAVRQRVEAVQTRVLAGADRAWMERELDGIAAMLSELEGSEPVRQEFAAWRSALEGWRAARGQLAEGSPPPPAGAVVLARNRLSGALALEVAWQRPPWVDELARRMPFLIAWVLGFALLSMVMAWRLQVVLSEPLARLARAADRVAQGQLDTPLPTDRGLPELSLTATSLEAMRRQLVETLREMDARARMRGALLEALQDGVLLVDREGRIVERNPRATAIFSELGVTGPVDRLATVLPEVPRTAPTGRSPVDLEVVRPRPGGGRIWLEVAVRPLDVQGPLQDHAVVVVRDVTDAREVEQLKRDFLSVVTHELKTPLTAIEGYTRLLLSGRAGPLNPRQRRFLEVVRDQTAALGEMVQNLLDSSRLEGGHLSIHFEEVDVVGLLRRVAEAWRPAAEQRGIRLVAEVDGARGARVEGDEQRLQQVFGNLVSNALKFTPKGGVVRLAASLDGDDVVVRVQDTGPGIPPSEAGRIFEKFYQVARGDTRPSGGAGLGLYIVRQLVEAHGGTVHCVAGDASDTGATFVVRLPLHRAGTAASGKSPDPAREVVT